MKKILLILLIMGSLNVQAQPVYIDRIGFKLESIAGIDIGWMTIRKHTTAPTGKQLGDRVYSAKQIGNCQQFVEWMQQSYLPKGCLGDATYYQNYIPKFNSSNSVLGNEINLHARALPLLYGAQSAVYMYLKKDPQGKFVPQNNLAEYWHMEANQLQYISAPVYFISSPEQYYFVMPHYHDGVKSDLAADHSGNQFLGFDINKNIQPYLHLYIPPKVINDVPNYMVIMTKDGKLPFENVSIGEFFERAEQQLPHWQQIGDYSAENLATARQNLARLKEKYKNKLNEIATLGAPYGQINFIDFVNAKPGYSDFFDTTEETTKFPIQKVSKAAMELCKTDQPQWLVIRWTLGMPNSSFNVHLMESILNNFNFDYVYKYFFSSTIITEPYKPLRTPTYKEPAVKEEISATKKEATTDKNVFYFDDFSEDNIGKPSASWNSNLRNGKRAEVKQIAGDNTKWLELHGRIVSPTNIKYPLPQNFTFSYDIVATQHFTWGAKGLTMLLSKETSPGNAESFIRLKLRPGFDGKDGTAELETKFPFPPGYSNESKGYTAPGFSNDKKNNRIKVTIKKTGEQLQVFIDKTEIAAYEKAIPAALLFNALSFDCSGNSAENDIFYIGNIKITKD